eukprot:7411573-Ditylum_brightwellii.AAC.1
MSSLCVLDKLYGANKKFHVDNKPDILLDSYNFQHRCTSIWQGGKIPDVHSTDTTFSVCFGLEMYKGVNATKCYQQAAGSRVGNNAV